MKGRPDTLYGKVIIEYKVPGTLRSEAKLQDAVEECQKNINEITKKYDEEISSYVGIITDGFQITFTKFRRDQWITEQLSDITEPTLTRLLEYLRGLVRKPLHPDFIVKDFGPGSELAKSCVQKMYMKLIKSKSSRVQILFQEWKKTFSQVCAYDLDSPKIDVQELIDTYVIPFKGVDFSLLLFSVHSYYALVIKLLAAEITVTYATPFIRSFIEELLNVNAKGFYEKLLQLEEGGVFSELGIKNFLEGDFFAWYLDIWDTDMYKVAFSVTKELSSYEPATATLEPDEVRDLLKQLYQNLVPKKVRHDLGEFFSPDWLAELVLNDISYDALPESRILDPSCGSGTFLVLAIKRIRERTQGRRKDYDRLLAKIIDNVIGFDLNPLAIIAARTNYLMALGDLLRFRKNEISIPIYLADSISMTMPRQQTLDGPICEVSTTVAKFTVPAKIVELKLVDEVFALADECIKSHYDSKEFISRLNKEFQNIDESSGQLLQILYDKILKLELDGNDRIWTRLIKNSFAPLFCFLVGLIMWLVTLLGLIGNICQKIIEQQQDPCGLNMVL
jgi:hypothetical protein